MGIRTGDAALDRQLNNQLFSIAARGTPQGNLLSAEARIREAAFYDFSHYQFMLRPHYLRGLIDSPYPGDEGLIEGTNVSIGVWLEFEDFVRLFNTDVRGVVAEWFRVESVQRIKAYDDYIQYWYIEGWEKQRRQYQVYVSAEEGFRLGMAPAIFEIYTVTDRPDEFLLAAYQAITTWFAGALRRLRGTDGFYTYRGIASIRESSFWARGVPDVLAALAPFVPAPTEEGDEEQEEFGDSLPEHFSFEPFRPGTVNFGLQEVYRQSWIPMGTQPGEIVRTLPLGPKQTEKVSIKAIRRTKATRQTEVSTSIETATESSASVKDSSEVIQEASESFNWHVEATASASFGFGSASLTAGAGGENASSSKDTKSLLNETMEKTSSKIRKDTKIVVSTEVEETSEFSQISEITNPNDEIAVTYIYSRLQRQYEIQTYLSEVNTVVFVAERMPTPEEITGEWIRRYDWIIARSLLDDSFRSDLDVVRSHEREVLESDDVDPNIRRLMQTLSGDGSGAASGVPGYQVLRGEIPDLYQPQQAAYEREIQRKRAKEAEEEQFRRSVRRLRAHIYDNVLHYCREIWKSEDPDTRLLRYSHIRVPIKWEYVSTGSGPHSSRGYFSPSVTDVSRDTAPLSDIINPAGPIGFAGNYSIFYLKHSSRWNSLVNMLRILETPYLKAQISIDTSSLSGDVGIRGAVSDNIAGPTQLRLDYALNADRAPILKLFELQDSDTWVFMRDIRIREGGAIVCLGVKLWLTDIDRFSDGDSFVVSVKTQQVLEDPEIKSLRWSIVPLAPEDRADFFSVQVIGEMRGYFADVYSVLQAEPNNVAWGDLSAAQQELLESRYYEYILRNRHTRRILIDTNNLLLTREVDDATTLEPFKSLHRVFDVLSASEKLNLESLENARRHTRIENDLLGDPEVEKVTVVAAAGDIASLAALDGITADSDDTDDGDDTDTD